MALLFDDIKENSTCALTLGHTADVFSWSVDTSMTNSRCLLNQGKIKAHKIFRLNELSGISSVTPINSWINKYGKINK